MKISSGHFQPIEIFLFSSPTRNLKSLKISIGDEIKIYQNDLIVKNITNQTQLKNFTISWKFKHILVKFEGEKLPVLTHGMKNQLKVNFFAIQSRLGDELINLSNKMKIIDFFSNLGTKSLRLR
jgi:hypothetical protein